MPIMRIRCSNASRGDVLQARIALPDLSGLEAAGLGIDAPHDTPERPCRRRRRPEKRSIGVLSYVRAWGDGEGRVRWPREVTEVRRAWLMVPLAPGEVACCNKILYERRAIPPSWFWVGRYLK